MLRLIPADYRTTDAVTLLAGMHGSGDFSPVPLLVDAMRDAGAPDAVVRHVLLGCVCAAPLQDSPLLAWAGVVEEMGEVERAE